MPNALTVREGKEMGQLEVRLNRRGRVDRERVGGEPSAGTDRQDGSALRR